MARTHHDADASDVMESMPDGMNLRLRRKRLPMNRARNPVVTARIGKIIPSKGTIALEV